MSIGKCPLCNKVISFRFPVHDCTPPFKLNDRVIVDEKCFLDNKQQIGKIIHISPNGNRFVIHNEGYPKRFSVSKKYCKHYNEV